MVWHEAEYVGQRHSCHVARSPSGIDPQFSVTVTAQESFQSQTTEEEHGNGGIEEQSCAEVDSQGVPLEADIRLQSRTAEVLPLLQRQCLCKSYCKHQLVIHGLHDEQQSKLQSCRSRNKFRQIYLICNNCFQVFLLLNVQ